MTPALRKYHRIVWSSFALVLPVCFLAAVFSIHEPQTNQRPIIDQPEALTRILKTAHAEQCIVRIRTNAMNTERQLEVIVRKPLDVPEALVQIHSDAAEPTLIGKLGSIGTYRFSLGQRTSDDRYHIKFVNPFTQIVFDQISI